MNAINRAIEVCSSQKALSERIGVTPSAVGQWVSGIRPVPAARCIKIEEATGGKVTRYELRPDVFGEPQNTKNANA